MLLKKVSKKIKEYGILVILSYILKIVIKRYRILQLKKKINNINFINDIENNFKTNMLFFYNNHEIKKLINFYKENNFLKQQILEDAESIIEHKFDLLGSGVSSLGNSINWNQDFKSGFIWKNEFYKNIKIIDLNMNADVKVPWELSRFQHIFTLGKAYWITEDIKYYMESKKQIIDWTKQNPVYMSVNWTCSMDVAIRAVNFIFFYYQFKDIVINDNIFLNLFNNSLYQHAKYIWMNLEKGLGPANNHYLSNLTGLLFIGLYFKNSRKKKESKKWYKFALKELEKEMIIENNEDGTNYESSTCYHKLVIELLFFSLLIGEKNGLEFSSKYKRRLKKMFIFLASITKPNGLFPMIGDVDNGRLIILSNYYSWKVNDARSLFNLGEKYFQTKFFNTSNRDVYAQEEEMIVLGNYDKDIKLTKEMSCQFSDGGYYILRNKNIYCLIRCGELSCRGLGGHSHNDQLSFELNIKGEDFFIDSGTGVYTSDKQIRNLFRSTAMHNTVSVRGIEQNNYDEHNLFSMPEQTFAKCINIDDKKFEGEHFGYVNKIGSVHNRKIYLEEDIIIIQDTLRGNSGIMNLHIAPNVKLKLINDVLIFKKNKIEIFIDVTGKKFEVLDSNVSPSYGLIKKNKKIEFYFDERIELKIRLEQLYEDKASNI